ncbi:MAG: GNAT family N-acetyltransferase [Chthoniobacterales bacterium]
MTAPRGSAEDLQISAPDPGTDGPKLIDLLCKTFAVSAGYWQGERICRDGLLLNSNYDWNASRVGKLGSEIVSHFGIWKLQVRVGRARILTAGIGSVATDGHYRKRGFLRQTANATLEALRDSDYEVSVLFGIPNFYEQFGYCRAWTFLNATIEVGQISTEAIPGKLERCRSAARSDLAALYNRENANLTGTAVRPVFPLGNPLVESDAYLWKQHQQVAGFVFVGVNRNTLEVRSWAGNPEVILAVVRRLAKARGLATIQFRWIHYQSQLSRFLRRQNSDFKSDYRSSGGPMIRAISLQRFTRRLLPELEDRLRRSHLSGWSGDLLVDDSQEAVTLRIKQGKIELLPGSRSENSISGGEAIAQLMFGTDDPQETIDSGGIRLRGQAKFLVPVLFPNEYPALSFWDRF